MNRMWEEPVSTTLFRRHVGVLPIPIRSVWIVREEPIPCSPTEGVEHYILASWHHCLPFVSPINFYTSVFSVGDVVVFSFLVRPTMLLQTEKERLLPYQIR
jgi:hypothetical protein